MSSEGLKLALRHFAVIARWKKVQHEPSSVYAEWDVSFSVRRRGLTKQELLDLVVEHQRALEQVLTREFGDEISLAYDFLSFLNMSKK